MEILVIALVAYLIASPDPLSLALTRGSVGAAKGAATGRTPSSKTSKPRKRALLAGWREGIAAARTRREAGHDLWSYGTLGAGAVVGGTVSLVKGIHGTIQAHRAQPDDPDDVTSPDAVPSRRGWTMPRRVRRPRTTPTSDASVAVVDEDGREVGKGSEAPEASTEPAPEPASTDGPDAELARLKDEAKKAEGVIAALRPSLHSTAGDSSGTGMTTKEAEDRTREIAAGDGEEADAARRLLKHLDTYRNRLADTNAKIGQLEPQPAPQATPTPIATRVTSNGETAMPQQTELGNVDELAAETKTMENVFTDLAAAIDRAKKWGINLPDRWSAANWGTKGLDRAVSDLSEEVASIKMPALESFASVRARIAEARTLGEAADAVQAHGKTEAFRSN